MRMFSSFRHWIQYFFYPQELSDEPDIEDLKVRAAWVGLALALLSINELVIIFSQASHSWPYILFILFNAFLPMAAILGSFCVMWVACRSYSSKGKTLSIPFAPFGQHAILILLFVLAIVGSITGIVTLVSCFLPPAFPNDGTSLDINAARLLLENHNPYTDSNIIDVARHFHIQANWTTPLRLGQFANDTDYPSLSAQQQAFAHGLSAGQAIEFESKVSYPAFAFLIFMPFALFKYYNVSAFYLLIYFLIIVIGWKIAPKKLRPWMLLLALANIPMWDSTASGNLDVFNFLLMILAGLLQRDRWKSSLLFGLALATKQAAWLVAPFYLLFIVRNKGWKEAIYRAAIMGTTGIIINLPFILWNSHAWLAGIFAPVTDPMFPLGVGIISLSITHLLPFLPQIFYTALELGSFIGLLLWYWKLSYTTPEFAIILAVIPLFFAWRSLPSYFSCTCYPVLILLIARLQTQRKQNAFRSKTLSDHKSTLEGIL